MPSDASQDLQRTFGGSIPAFYDEYLGPAWFGPIAADLAHRVPVDPGGDVLELACGTGLMTRPLRNRLDARRKLVATDLNKPMLDYARSKMTDLAGIEWREADAAKLPFADGTFGAVACSLGVMFIPDRAALFREVRRVIKPGGVFVFNVWDRIEHNPCVRIYSDVIESLYPGDAEVKFRVPYEMADEQLLLNLVTGGGFNGVTIKHVTLPVQGVSARQVATGQVRGTPRGLLLAKRGADFDQVIDKVTAALEAQCGAGHDFRAQVQVMAAIAAVRS
jgi:SAM-dependent methyltransferase